MSTTSFWDKVTPVPPDPIFATALEAKKAPEPKVDLIIGAYRDEDGRPYPLKVVQKAERCILDKCLDKEYLPMLGHAPFIDAALKLVYGDSVPRENLVGVHGLSGTGALSLGFHFLAQVVPRDTPVYVSDPTWTNHYVVIEGSGLTNVRTYRYYNPATHFIDFDGLMEDLRAAPEGSIIVLHACAHNPTGVDPTQEQWMEIAEVVKARRLIPFFDSAYQGYATGDLENDAFAIRLFARQRIELLLAQSFSKNMGMYAERVGVCSVLLKDPAKASAVSLRFERIVRAYYSSPPAHGARVAHLILSDAQLRAEWEAELRKMSQRVMEMRKDVYDGLKNRGTPGNWEHVIKQVGMFSYLGLSKTQCETLCKKRVFVLSTGRTNMASLTKKTTKMLVDAIDDVVRASIGK